MNVSKYRNRITWVGGIRFASEKEANRYSELKLLERAGEISGLHLQPGFVLQPGFSFNGHRIRAIKYIADFSYLENGEIIIEDVKGKQTDMFKLKCKMMKYVHDIDLRLT